MKCCFFFVVVDRERERERERVSAPTYAAAIIIVEAKCAFDFAC